MKQVSVSNFYVSYNDTEILKDISFDLLAGEVTGLLARNGEGKTTLLNSIAGLKDYEGSISVFGKSPNLYDRDFKKN